MNRIFLYLLRRMYKKLDITITCEENICRDCYKCCTAAARQKVSSVEEAYIKKYLIDQNLPLTLMEDYERFLNDRQNLYDRSVHNILCPFYDRDKKHCFIYPARPYSCRIYGRFSVSKDDLPGKCIYKKTTKIYREKDLFKTVPCSEDYASIAAAYKIYIKYVAWWGKIFYKI